MMPRSGKVLIGPSADALRLWCYKAWHDACAKAGLPDLFPCDLRRSTVKHLIKSGVPEFVAMQITGNKSRETFRRYNIVDTTDIANAIKRVDDYVRREKEMGPTIG